MVLTCDARAANWRSQHAHEPTLEPDGLELQQGGQSPDVRAALPAVPRSRRCPPPASSRPTASRRRCCLGWWRRRQVRCWLAAERWQQGGGRRPSTLLAHNQVMCGPWHRRLSHAAALALRVLSVCPPPPRPPSCRAAAGRCGVGSVLWNRHHRAHAGALLRRRARRGNQRGGGEGCSA